MKNLYLIISLLLLSLAASAQNQSIDSLKKELKTLPQDTSRVNVLNGISTIFIESNHFDSAFRYAKTSMDLSEKLHYTSGASVAYHNLALYNFHIKEYKIGKFFLIKSLTDALAVSDKKGIAGNYKELANLYQLQGNFKLEAESKNKFGLYRDSLAKEENDKHAAELKVAYDLKEKEKAELAANDAKSLAVKYESQRQQIFNISLIVLLVLSILIVWLIVSRSKIKAKKKAALLAEKVEIEQNEILRKAIEQKNRDIEKIVFLQKMAEKEALATKTNVAKKQPAVIITEIIKPNVEEEKVVEKIVAEEKETVSNKIEEKPETEEEQIEKEEPVVATKIDEVAVVEPEKVPAVILGSQYSNIIFFTQLLNFSAKLVEEKIKLLWKTNNENNIVSFGVQKSVDDTQYVNIETIAAKGFDGNEYETFDLQPLPGINYYRLEIFDTDGNFIFSPTIKVEVLPATTLTLVSYPTHVKDVIMVTAAGGKLPVLVNIYDASGKKEFTIEVPPVTTPIYLTSLAVGTYTLQMKCQGKTVLQQLIKVAS